MGSQFVRSVAEQFCAGTPAGATDAGVHKVLAEVVVAAYGRAREMAQGLGTVALSGGVFQSVLLAERITSGLEAARFPVLTHWRVRTNDGGISLAQPAIVGTRDAHGGYDLPW
jgi:hydrogenase maturation protein HypF